MKVRRTADPARTTRRVSHTKSYGPFLRLADRLAGQRDRRPLRGLHEQVARTPLVAKLQATFDENDCSNLARTQDVCRAPALRLRELCADLGRLHNLIERAQSELASIAPTPAAEELTVRTGGELHLDDFAVATRRRRDHAARIARARSAVETLEDERNHHLIECARHAARLIEEFELGRTISERLRHYYNRRLANYARHARIAGAATPTIAAPKWTTEPCPWLPEGLRSGPAAATSTSIGASDRSMKETV